MIFFFKRQVRVNTCKFILSFEHQSIVNARSSFKFLARPYENDFIALMIDLWVNQYERKWSLGSVSAINRVRIVNWLFPHIIAQDPGLKLKFVFDSNLWTLNWFMRGSLALNESLFFDLSDLKISRCIECNSNFCRLKKPRYIREFDIYGTRYETSFTVTEIFLHHWCTHHHRYFTYSFLCSRHPDRLSTEELNLMCFPFHDVLHWVFFRVWCIYAKMAKNPTENPLENPALLK